MPEHNPTANAKPDEPQPKVEPTKIEGPVDDLVSLSQLAGGPIAAVGGNTIQSQAARLGDVRLQGAQRQCLGVHIGQVPENRQLPAFFWLLTIDLVL